MGQLKAWLRMWAQDSTDEWWLGLALIPGVMGGGVLRFVLMEQAWVVIWWNLAWLAVAAIGTLWLWVRDRSSHLPLLAVYLVLGLVFLGLGIAGWR